MVQTDNSVNGDASIFSQPPANATSAFLNVSTILKKNCVPCHAGDIASFTEEQLVSQGYVVPKNPDGSLLYERLNGSNAGGGLQEDMPKGEAPLSSNDLATIRSWINQIDAITPIPTLTPVPSPSPHPDTPFGNAYAIITVSCVSCHHHQTWANFSESDFVTGGLVTPGNADTSTLYQRLIGANVAGVAAGDMPKTGAPLTADQLLTISTWIDQISAVAPSPSPSPVVSPSPSVLPSSVPTPSPSAPAVLLSASQRTAAALAVISNECADCHGGSKTATSSAFSGQTVAAFGGFTADTDFVSSGLIKAGDPANSWIIRALKGYGDLALMPTDDGAIPSDEEATLVTWISGIGQP